MDTQTVSTLPVHDTIDSTTLIITRHEFLFRIFSLDQSFSQSGTDFAVVLILPSTGIQA